MGTSKAPKGWSDPAFILASSGKFIIIRKRTDNSGKEEKKAPKGRSKSPWSLHMRSFWKILFINSPEVQRQVVWSKRNGRVR
jgi:hypothetical protein